MGARLEAEDCEKRVQWFCRNDTIPKAASGKGSRWDGREKVLRGRTGGTWLDRSTRQGRAEDDSKISDADS